MRTPESVTNTVLRAIDVTPNDTNDLATPTKGIYIGVAGDVKVDMANGGTVTFKALSVGVIHPIAAKRVYATGTTATSIIGLY